MYQEKLFAHVWWCVALQEAVWSSLRMMRFPKLKPQAFLCSSRPPGAAAALASTSAQTLLQCMPALRQHKGKHTRIALVVCRLMVCLLVSHKRRTLYKCLPHSLVAFCGHMIGPIHLRDGLRSQAEGPNS